MFRGDGFTVDIAERRAVAPEHCPPDSRLGETHAALRSAQAEADAIAEPRNELRAALAAKRAELADVARMTPADYAQKQAEAAILAAQVAEVDAQYNRALVRRNAAEHDIRRGWHTYNQALAHWKLLADLDRHQALRGLKAWAEDLAETAVQIREWDGGASLAAQEAK